MNLVAAGRAGDWERHLMTVKLLIPIFEELGSMNYLRYTSFYLKMMRELPKQFPEKYEQL